jgi:hypothetical protein
VAHAVGVGQSCTLKNADAIHTLEHFAVRSRIRFAIGLRGVLVTIPAAIVYLAAAVGPGLEPRVLGGVLADPQPTIAEEGKHSWSRATIIGAETPENRDPGSGSQ